MNVQSRDVSVAESDTEMMTENVYLGQEQYQPKELQVSAASLIGSRRNQQDSLCYTSLPDKGFLAVVCDGMGGLGGGEMASYTACAGMVDAFEKCGDAQPADFFVRTASEIDVSVAGIADAEGVPIGAGTTHFGSLDKRELYALDFGGGQQNLSGARSSDQVSDNTP